MARKKAKRRAPKATVPLALAAPLAAKGYNLASGLLEGGDATRDANYFLTGNADGSLTSAGLIQAWGPVLVGAGIHMAASKLGVNRTLGRMHVPWIRV